MAPFTLTFEATPRSRVAENRPSAHDRSAPGKLAKDKEVQVCGPCKGTVSQWEVVPPGKGVAPAGSNRSDGGR